MNCKHQTFKADCKVFRRTDGDDGPVIGYSMDVTVKCVDCGEVFEFIGPPAGASFKFPTVSADLCTLRIPIQPATGRMASEMNYELQREPNDAVYKEITKDNTIN